MRTRMISCMSDESELLESHQCLDYKPTDTDDCSNPKCRYIPPKSTASEYTSVIDCKNKSGVQCNLVVQFGLCNNEYYKVSSLLSRRIQNHHWGKI